MLLHEMTSPVLPTGAMILPRYASVTSGASEPTSVVTNVHDLLPPVTTTGPIRFCADPRSTYDPPDAVQRCVIVHSPDPDFRHVDPAYEIDGALNDGVETGFGAEGCGATVGFGAPTGAFGATTRFTAVRVTGFVTGWARFEAFTAYVLLLTRTVRVEGRFTVDFTATTGWTVTTTAAGAAVFGITWTTGMTATTRDDTTGAEHAEADTDEVGDDVPWVARTVRQHPPLDQLAQGSVECQDRDHRSLRQASQQRQEDRQCEDRAVDELVEMRERRRART